MRTDPVAALQPAGDRDLRSTDPDNPVWSDEEFRRGRLARKLRGLRSSLDLSQKEFADRHGLDATLVAAWEKGREPFEEAVLRRIVQAETGSGLDAEPGPRKTGF